MAENKQKCNCGKEATHQFNPEDGTEIIYLCDTHHQDFIKCQECKTNNCLTSEGKIRMRAKIDGSIARVCEDCSKFVELAKKIKTLQEKILDEGHPELKTSTQFYKDGKWDYFGTCIWVRRISKEYAQQFKTLLEPLRGKSEEQLNKIFAGCYWHWMSWQVDCSFNVEKQEFKILTKGAREKSIVHFLSEFLQELEDVITGKVEDFLNKSNNRARERERGNPPKHLERRFSLWKM